MRQFSYMVIGFNLGYVGAFLYREEFYLQAGFLAVATVAFIWATTQE